MKSITYTIKDELGIHARPAGMLAKEGKNYQSKITIEANGKSADVTRLMSIMAMGVKKDCEVTISAEGPDEDAAIAGMEKFFQENL